MKSHPCVVTLALAAFATPLALAQPAPPSALKNAPATATPASRAAPHTTVPSRFGAPAASPPAAQPAGTPGLTDKPLQQAPQAPVAPAPATAAQPAAKAAAGQQAVPDDLFKMDDRAIIIVGGKSRPAGEVKREIKAELQRLSGAPKTMRAARALPPRPQRMLSSAGLSQRNRHATAVGEPVAASGGLIERHAAGLKLDCSALAPKITRVRAALSPNRRVAIDGMCFGQTAGAVEAIGQFPGGNMKLVFERWSESQVVAFVPAVRGAADHAVALTVVRADGKRTPAAQANFVAARERVEVPERAWKPAPRLDHTDTRSDGGLFHLPPDWSTRGKTGTPLAVAVNPACALDDVVVTATVGAVTGLRGWVEGPPHESGLEVAWAPQCTRTNSVVLFYGSSKEVCRIAFAAKAWASCPVGIQP
jgi:hypothetical protein